MFLDEARLRMAVAEERDLHVGHAIEEQETTARLAVLGQETHPRVHRRAGVFNCDFLTVDQDRTRGGRRHSEQCLCDVAAPRTYEAGEAQNFPLTQIKRHAVELAFETEVSHRERHIADGHRLFWKHLGDLSTDHQADDVVASNISGEMLTDEAAVTEDRNLVGDLK